MAAFATTAILSFLLYLIFTTASGAVLVWSGTELLFGAAFALMVAAMTRRILHDKWPQILNPRRLLLFIVYLFGPFLVALAKAIEAAGSSSLIFASEATPFLPP